MKICNKCGKENNQDNTFCNNCGNKFDNYSLESNLKKNKIKTVLIKIGIILSVVLVAGIVSLCLFLMILGKIIDNGINNIKDKIDAYEEKEQIREEIYDSIPKELLNRNLISKNLKYVNYAYAWSGEWPDKTDKYYFYIDSNNYDKYKSYWLEDVNKKNYSEGYNRNLWETGDYVFTAINVTDLKYSDDEKYGNVQLKANKQYYLVQIYDEAIYFKYVWNYKEDGSYIIDSNFKYKNNSLLKEYIFSQDGDSWIVEELTR